MAPCSLTRLGSSVGLTSESEQCGRRRALTPSDLSGRRSSVNLRQCAETAASDLHHYHLRGPAVGRSAPTLAPIHRRRQARGSARLMMTRNEKIIAPKCSQFVCNYRREQAPASGHVATGGIDIARVRDLPVKRPRDHLSPAFVLPNARLLLLTIPEGLCGVVGDRHSRARIEAERDEPRGGRKLVACS